MQHTIYNGKKKKRYNWHGATLHTVKRTQHQCPLMTIPTRNTNRNFGKRQQNGPRITF